jgi:hypothetical protein
MPFNTNVFVNCPFDDDYLPLLRPLLFTIIDLGFEPRIALENLDSGTARIEKIIALIKDSKFGVHDLSRLQAQNAGEYYRLNMPFELGLDVGCRRFRDGQWSDKRCLMLESQRYRYQAALSDMSNSDIAVHNNEPADLVFEIRKWLTNVAKLRAVGAAQIWGRFNDFMTDNSVALKARGFSDRDIERLPVNELITCIKDWVRGDQ